MPRFLGFVVCLKIVVQEREFSEYLRNQPEIMRGYSCRIIAVSMILAHYTRNVIKLHTLGKVHISVARAGDTINFFL